MTLSSTYWQIEFAQPLWFALLAALPLLLIFWRWSLVQFSPGRKIVSLLLRSLLLLFVAAGLAGPKATGPDGQAIVDCQWLKSDGAAPPQIELTVPDQIRAGEPFSLNVLLRSKATGKATVELLCDGQSLLKEPVALAVGENQIIFPAMVPKPSQVVYSVRVKDEQGAWPDNNESACAIYVDPPPRVLLVESQSALAEHLKKALAGENVEVEVRPELPAGPLAVYDLIILSNVPASALPEPRMKALQTFVRDDRGGLIAIGGDRSFSASAGGYRHTTLEEILPVISEVRKDIPKPTLAMVLVLDISASMNDPSANKKLRNIDLAKQALRTAVNMLRPRDQVGVLVFEDHSRWIWPLAPVTNKQEIIARIDTIQAEGSTNMYPPLEQAYLALHEAYSDLKHIIVTTDGLGEPGDFDGLAQKMAAAGITMTTVGVGSEPARPFLQSIAAKAKGRAYFCPDAEKVPRIFETDTGIVAKIGITEEPFFPRVIHTAQVLRGLDMSQAPTLLGYVETQARPESHVVLASKSGEPILAFWRYGGGTTAAFTSDIHGDWAGPWLNWSGFGRFWVQLVRQTMRHDVPKRLQLAAEAGDGRLWFTLDAADRDGRFINEAEASVTVTSNSPLPPGEGRGEGSESHTVLPLTQIAPGRYAGSQAAGQGTYWLEGQIHRDGKLIDSVRSGIVVLHTPEVVAKLEGSLVPAVKTGLRTILLWPWLLGAGLVVLVIDLAVRRTGKAT